MRVHLCDVFTIVTTSHNAVRALFGIPKNQNGDILGKTFCCVLFCPSSRGKNPNLSFFRIPNEKCRHNLCLRAIKRHVDEKREWRENSTAAKLEYKSPGLTHLCSLSCIFLSTLFLKFELSEFGPPLTWTPQRVHIC